MEAGALTRSGREGPEPAAGRTIRGLDAAQRRALRREQLLDTAFDLFARDGYASVSIEQICQSAYVGNKAFYEVFDGKEGCYLALLRRTSERVEQQMTLALQQSADHRNEDAATRRLLTVFAHALVDDPRVASVTFGAAAGISPRIEAQRRENRRWAAAFVEAFWRGDQTIRGGDLDDFDYSSLAVASVGGLFEAVTDWLHENDSSQPQAIDSLIANLTTFMTVVAAGIAARAT